MGDRYDSLQPPFLISSIESMPRRWKDALRVPPPKNIDDYFSVAGDDGSAAEHMGAAISQLTLLRDALRTTSYNIPEPLDTSVAAAVDNSGSGPWPKSAEVALADLTEQFDGLLAQLKALNPSDWNKSADAGSRTLTVLALAQATTRVAADRLMIVERVIRTVAD